MINMKGNNKCDLICEGIKDEIGGQEFYEKLIKETAMSSDERNILVDMRADEIRHEKILRKIDSQNNCSCNIPSRPTNKLFRV